MRHQPITALSINIDPTVTYLPSCEAEIELLVSDAQLNAPIYQHNYDADAKRLVMIYRKNVQTICGIKLYQLKQFVIEQNDFDLTAFKSFFSACFPHARVNKLSKAEAKEICKTFLTHIKQAQVSSHG